MIRNALCATLLVLTSRPAIAQHEHGATGEMPADQAAPMEHGGFLGIPHGREGSGTAWLPSSSPIFAWHVPLGGSWGLMFHGNLFAGLDAQGTDRGATEAFSVNWAMAMLQGRLGPGQLALRTMFSAEPWTVANGGYPLLLQTGETFEGEPLHDRQHPHDLFMELAASYALQLGRDFALSLYAGLPGEPAIGPVAYPHRISAYFNPAAPIGHHWQDATHITFGVLTLGAFTKNVRLEASAFNGREPNENRTGIDTPRLDSFSARLQFALGEDWVGQISSARLNEPESLHPGENITRSTASIGWNVPLTEGGNVAATAVWGANYLEGELTSSGLIEASVLFPGERFVAFGRTELIQKSAEELVVPGDDVFLLGDVSLGGIVEFPEARVIVPGIGAAGTLSVIPGDLEPFYGTRVPLGLFVFVHLRPPLSQMHGGHMAMD